MLRSVSFARRPASLPPPTLSIAHTVLHTSHTNKPTVRPFRVAPTVNIMAKRPATNDKFCLNDDDRFELLYWPQMLGRGELVRLLLAECNRTWSEPLEGKSFEEAAAVGYQKGGSAEFPHFAMPVLRIYRANESKPYVDLAQVPAILPFLAKQLDNRRLFPVGELDSIKARELMAGIVDFVSEGHDAYHTPDPSGGYEEQKDACDAAIQVFKEKRLPKWLNFFEGMLRLNNANQQDGYFVGDKLSYIDIAYAYVLEGAIALLPEDVKKSSIPLSHALKDRVYSRPNIVNHIQGRKAPFHGKGIIF